MSQKRSARRAVIHWALRLFAREWRQQALVLTLLTVVVGAAVAGSTIAVNAASDSTGAYGSGGALVRIDGANPARVQSVVAQVRQEFGVVDVIAHAPMVVPGSVQHLDVRDQDPNGAYSKPMLGLVKGRYPVAAGEVALTRHAGQLLDVAMGSDLQLSGAMVHVIGVVENPANLSDDFVLVTPGSLSKTDSLTVLVDVRNRVASTSGSGNSQPRFGLESGGSQRQAIAATVLAASTLALALVGLVATAGFVVVAQRRQRQLGLLSALGATDQNVRLVMIANGTFVGIVAAAIGMIAGIVGWMLAADAVESAANHRINRFDLPWTLILAVVLLAVVMATLAAWWPARAATRLPVMAALSGRPALPRPVHRSVVVALGFLVIGVTCVVVASPTGTSVQPLLLIAGLLAIVTSSVFSAPAAIRMLGPLARWLPFSPRLALRDLARYQSRAAAALAAITLGLGIAISVVAIAAANQDRSNEGNLSNRELLIEVGDLRTATNPSLTAAEVQQLDERADSIVVALGNGTSSVPLDVAFNTNQNQQTAIHEPVSLGTADSAHSIKFVSYPFLATPAVLHLYGIDPNKVQQTADILTIHNEPMLLIDFSKRIEPGAPPVPTQHVALPSYSSAPNSLITPDAVRRHGWVTARAAWIVESPHPFTSAQLKAARTAAVNAGLAIEIRSRQDGLSTLRTDATLVGAMLALAIVAMAVGLIRGESRRDILTLTATGASAGTRRALTASTAAALATLGVLLALCGAYTALIAAYHSDLGKLLPLPLTHLLGLTVGLPAFATAAGWLLAGSDPTTFARQTLD